MKILYNNLLEKFTDNAKKNDKLVQLLEKMDPEKVQALENQLEKFKLMSNWNEKNPSWKKKASNKCKNRI